MNEPRDFLSRYARLPESNGCRNACITHLVMMTLLFILAVSWIVRNRAWEYVIKIEW
ncbi:MAG: hypothetical protein IPK32_07290 [Verrucomicrobiaceae bacterium]|nr:hypothetical protein [Verrucomicrobiaceae bacterium]